MNHQQNFSNAQSANTPGEITVKAHPNASSEKVEEKEGVYHVWVKAVADKGKANKAIVKVLKNYFGKEVVLKRGEKSRVKVVVVRDS